MNFVPAPVLRGFETGAHHSICGSRTCSSDSWAAIGMPLLAVTGWPSVDTRRHSNSVRPLMRLAERSGSMAAEKAIIENCGTSRNATRIGDAACAAAHTASEPRQRGERRRDIARRAVRSGERPEAPLWRRTIPPPRIIHEAPFSTRRIVRREGCVALEHCRVVFAHRHSRRQADHDSRGKHPSSTRGSRQTSRWQSAAASLRTIGQSVCAHGGVLGRPGRGDPSHLAAHSRRAGHRNHVEPRTRCVRPRRRAGGSRQPHRATRARADRAGARYRARILRADAAQCAAPPDHGRQITSASGSCRAAQRTRLRARPPRGKFPGLLRPHAPGAVLQHHSCDRQPGLRASGAARQ